MTIKERARWPHYARHPRNQTTDACVQFVSDESGARDFGRIALADLAAIF
ncbi:MAG: hypothetical protein NTX28_00555 [Novosphingobium sp.]|nr:hypothetical protein [Novosphingobium sp.]